MRKKTAGRPPPPDKPPTPPPDAQALREAALAYLARFASTEAGLARVLERRIDRWARGATTEPDTGAAVASARACIPGIVSELAASGAVSDAAFAESRSRALLRSGRSRRAIGAHLATRGVPATLAAGALPADPAQELAAALIHARKRRLGPWRKTGRPVARTPAQEGAKTPDIVRRELGSLARAGFARDVAARVLAYGQEEAEAAIAAFRADL